MYRNIASGNPIIILLCVGCRFVKSLIFMFSVHVFCISLAWGESWPSEFDKAKRIETLIVTGTLREAEASTSSLSWSKVHASDIRLLRHTHISELMQRVSGAWISRGSGQEHLTALRSPVLTGAGGCGSFYMAVDGIALRAPGFCNVNQLFDANSEQAAHIEVIKGPATALYGSNAMHGVINLFSVPPSKPKTHRFGVDLGGDNDSVDLNSIDYYRGRYEFSDHWGEGGLSVVANAASSQGFVDDTGFEQQKLSVRFDTLFGQWKSQNVFEFTNLNQETGGFITGFESFKDEELRLQNPNPEAYRDAYSLRAYSRLSKRLSPNNELILTPYLRSNEMTFMMHFLPWKPIEDNGHDSLGLRAHWVNSGTRYELISGIDIEYTKAWLKENQEQAFSLNQPQGVHYDYRVGALNKAIFAQLNSTVNSRILSELGLRYESMRYDYVNQASAGSACTLEASACRFYRPSDTVDTFDNGSVNFGLSFIVSDRHTVYSRLAQGFRAPQASELYRLQSGQQSTSLMSESIRSIELGMRGHFTEKYTYDINTYLMNKRDVIFQDANRWNVSGASTRHKGVDISLSMDVHKKLQWSLNSTISRHTYTSDIELLGVSSTIKGNDIDTAPHFFGSTQLTWDYRGQSTAQLEWVFMADYYLEPENRFRYDGHNVLNFTIEHALSLRANASLRVHNVLNALYANRADYGFNTYRYFVGEPRSIHVSLDFIF